MEKWAKRHKDEDTKKADQTSNLNRQYAKFMRIAASSTFRTANEYYDRYEGFWRVPQLGDQAPTVDTLFWLYADEPLRRWGADPRFAPSSGGGNTPEAAASTAELQLQSTVDTSTSLWKLAGATLPATLKATKAVPPPEVLDHRTARGQPMKTGSP